VGRSRGRRTFCGTRRRLRSTKRGRGGAAATAAPSAAEEARARRTWRYPPLTCACRWVAGRWFVTYAAVIMMFYYMYTSLMQKSLMPLRLHYLRRKPWSPTGTKMARTHCLTPGMNHSGTRAFRVLVFLPVPWKQTRSAPRARSASSRPPPNAFACKNHSRIAKVPLRRPRLPILLVILLVRCARTASTRTTTTTLRAK
jgi:hypothetical protein